LRPRLRLTARREHARLASGDDGNGLQSRGTGESSARQATDLAVAACEGLLTGRVTAPNGKEPIYDALVYVPSVFSPLPGEFSVSCATNRSAARRFVITHTASMEPSA